MINLRSTREHFQANRYIFYRVVFFFVVVYIIAIVLDYGKCFTVFDFTRYYYYKALANGPKLVWEDLVRIFDYSPAGFHITQPARFRYFQDLFLLVNFKFRVWLFNYLPPHPSLSLTWLFTLVLSPLFLYRLIYNLTRNLKASWTGVILFCLSTGSLSGITLLSNPAKPLAIFFTILCFYLASKISLSLQDSGCFTRRLFLIYLGMLSILLLSFLTDESTYIIYLCVPVVFPAIFGAKGSRAIVGGLYLLLLVIFIIFAVRLAPLVLKNYAAGKYDLWRDYFKSPDTDMKKVFEFFGCRYLVLFTKNLISSQLLPWGKPWWGIGYIGVGVYFIYVFRGMPLASKKLLLRALLVLALFVIFQGFLLATVYVNERYVFEYPFYYGSLLSVFLTLPLTILLSSSRGRYSNYIDRVILIGISIILAYNFIEINQDCRHIRCIQCWEDNGKMSFSLALDAWRSRKDKEALLALKAPFPPLSAWSYIQELEVIAEQHSAKYHKKHISDSPNLPPSATIVASAASYWLPQQNVDKLFDGDPASFWHVSAAPMGKDTWVKIDFGDGEAKRVRSLAARPRLGHPGQFFQMADLFGSIDGKTWELVAPIVQPALPQTDEWIRWGFANERSYRYYKLAIHNGYYQPKEQFFSMAELALSE